MYLLELVFMSDRCSSPEGGMPLVLGIGVDLIPVCFCVVSSWYVCVDGASSCFDKERHYSDNENEI